MIKLQTELGKITITADVFTTLAGVAATNCFGVRGMAIRSVTDGLVHLLKREVLQKGVHVAPADPSAPDESGFLPSTDHDLKIELHIVAKTGVNIPVVCTAIIEEVTYKVNRDTGVKIGRVDVYVDRVMTDEGGR
jgi:uncharacterized alkaline shock family protein YloU